MQLDIDFKPKPINKDPGKHTERLTITCSSEYKEFVDLFCKIQKMTTSELCHRYILEGMKNDLADIFIAQPHLDKSLRKILEQYS